MKRDLLLNWNYFLAMFLLVPVLTITNLPQLNIGLFSFVMHLIIFNGFYYDTKNNINQLIVSLPVKKENAVCSRYIFFLLTFLTFVLYQWFIDRAAHVALPYVNAHTFTLLDIVFLMNYFFFGMTIYIPLLYFSQLFIKGTIIQLGILFISVVNTNLFIMPGASIFPILILDTTIVQPSLIFTLFSVLGLYISYKISAWIFTNKDII